MTASLRISRLCLLLSLLVLPACGSKAPEEKKDSPPDAVAILKLAEETFNALDNFSCNVSVGNPLDSTAHQWKGKFYFSKNKYHIDLGDQIVCNGDSICTWAREFGMVTLGVFNPMSDLTLGGVYRLYRSNHSAHWEAKEGGLDRIDLGALVSDDLFKIKKVWVDPNSHLIVKYAFYSQQSGNYLYTLSDIKTNTNLDPKLFEFDRELIAKGLQGKLEPVMHGEEDGHDHGDHEGHDH